MKTSLTFLLLLFGFWTTAQTIRIADNNTNRPTGANIFSTLQAALDAAAPGDIVYITPSNVSYGNVTISKRVILKGVGFNIAELTDRSSTVGNITLLSSGDGVVSTSNSVFTGFNYSNIYFTAGGFGSMPYNDILIEKVRGLFISWSGSNLPINRLIIRESYIRGIGINATNSDVKIYRNIFYDTNVGCSSDYVYINTGSNPLITNNIFYNNNNAVANCGGGGGGNYYINITACTGTRIEHNLFSGTGYTFRNLFNTPVVNNIFYGVNPGTNASGVTFRDNIFSNNLAAPAQTFPPAAVPAGVNTGLGNLSGVSPLFLNGPPSSVVWSAVYDYTFPNTSPCYQGATTGDNIGPTGGLYPMGGNVVFGGSGIPVITLFNNSGVVPQSQPLKSNIKAKSN